MRLTLDSFVRRSDSRLSTSITILPIDVGHDGERELGQDQHDHAIELAAVEPILGSVVGRPVNCASRTTSSMISLPT